MNKLPQELKERIFHTLPVHNQRYWREANRNLLRVKTLHPRLRVQLLAVLKVGAVAGIPVSLRIENRDFNNNTYANLWQDGRGIEVVTGWPWTDSNPGSFTLQQSEAAVDEFVRRGQANPRSYLLEVKLEPSPHDARQDAATEMRAFDAAWSIFPEALLGFPRGEGWTMYARTPEKTYRKGYDLNVLREGVEVSRDAIVDHLRRSAVSKIQPEFKEGIVLA